MGLYDIFISYSRNDREFATMLSNALADKGFDVWRDLDDIDVGDDFWEKITGAIDNTRYFAFLISYSSLASVMCNLELEYAREKQKQIIPVVFSEFDPIEAHV